MKAILYWGMQVLEYSYQTSAEKRTVIRHLLVFVVLFFLLHVVFVLISFGNTFVRESDIIQLLVRLCTWTLPPVVYLWIKKEKALKYLCFTENIKKGLLWGTLIGSVIFVINAIGYYQLNHNLSMNLNLGWGLWLRGIILVGFSEELLFRGFFFNKLNEVTTFQKANLIQATLFLLVHIPGWIMMGMFESIIIIRLTGFIFFIGLLNGYLLKKTGSIWSCIMVHSLSNLASLTMGV